ncbi:MAG TPA: CSLREA domain-containing protein [Actinomycetota bacterium]|nr:CSLREA domain-containing protein [Actinomycetota bacterium]
MKALLRPILVVVLAVTLPALNPLPASALTFTVNTLGDAGDNNCTDGTCTLRDAILAAEANPDPDVIQFDITPDTPITPVAVLPTIDHPVTIDGFTDPTSERVELDGGGLAADGLKLAGEDTTIKGLVIRNFAQDGIDITGNGNRIEGNLIGTNAAGSAAGPGNLGSGVHVQGSDNIIGGSTAGARNVISANAENGVRIAGPNAGGNHVEGNYIGINAAGTASLGNSQNGVSITSVASGAAHDNVVGGASAALRNVISGNGQNGVRIFPAPTFAPPTGNLVQGNFIGSGADGTGDIGNGQAGVRIDGSSVGNSVGGTVAGAGNLISGNAFDGVRILGDATTKNAILGNSVSSNDQSGIDLEGGAGVNLNDTGDGDIGPNNLQNYPVLTSVFSATRVLIAGTLNSQANKVYRLEFFANAVCDGTNGEGQTFLGTTNVTTDAAGNAAFSVSLPAGVPAGQVITATATDPDNNTSEFSACKAVVADITPPSTPTTSAGGTFQKDITFTVSWSTSTDDLSGIFGYEVRYREAPYNGGFGGFVNWQKAAAMKSLATTTAMSATFTGTPGNTYCFSARAIDGAGNASPYGAEGCTSVPVDNTSFKHRGRWSKRTGVGYYLNTFSRTKQRGARLTLPAVQAKVLSIIVSKCRRCGVIKVFFKGKLLKRIVLRTKAATRQKLRFVNLKTFASPQTGTVRVTVVSRRKLVIVEGLGVSAV